MDAKDFFKLTARQYDRAQQFYRTHDKALMEESQEYEKQQLQEFVRVALINEEIAEFIRKECPFINKHVAKAREEENKKLQTKLF